MSGAGGAGGAAQARRPMYWLPLAVGGLLLGGAVVLYAGLSDWTGWEGPLRAVSSGPHPGVWTGLAPGSPTVYFPPPTSWFMHQNRLYGPAAFYLGWYWAVAPAAAFLGMVVWNRRVAGGRPRRGWLVAAVVLLALAVALPALTQALPWLSSVWLRQSWLKGFPVLIITAASLGVLARAERSRRLAWLAGGFAAVMLLTFAALEMPGVPIIGWPPFFGGLGYATRLAYLVLPAAVLITAGLAARRRRDEQDSPG